MSCALDPRFGMPALRDELSQYLVPNPAEPKQVEQWEMVRGSLQGGDDLEAALDNVADTTLLKKITSVTGRFIASIDHEYALKISNQQVVWPATQFFKRLVDTLPEGDKVLHVLTPNYDTLFEHACDAVGILYATGFFGGMERRMDWDAMDQSMWQSQRVAQRGRFRTVLNTRNHARLYKVHGSLNLFLHQNTVVENNAWMWDPPDFAERVMITPGLSKHEVLQTYRQELLRPADEAIDKANRFLFLGYGFNDSHLEEYINRKLITQGCKGLIVTRDSNPRIEALLHRAQNLWLVCKSSEVGDDGTRLFNKQYSNWLEMPAERLWDVQSFATEFFGA